jgi:hypothetical protein
MKTKQQLLDSFVNYRIVRKRGRLIKIFEMTEAEINAMYPMSNYLNPIDAMIALKILKGGGDVDIGDGRWLRMKAEEPSSNESLGGNYGLE